MIIKHSISFNLKSYGKTKTAYLIRLRATFNKQRVETCTGCSIDNLEFWDNDLERVKSGYKSKKGITSTSINLTLQKYKDQMETVFKYFEANDKFPSPQDVMQMFDNRLKGAIPETPKPSKSVAKPKEPNFFKVYDEFVEQCGEKNAWTKATFQKMAAMRADYKTFKKDIKFSDLTEKTLTAFVVFLRDDKKLKTPRKPKGDRKKYDEEDIVGLRNSTIKKKLGYMRWFLNWATDKGYNTNLEYKHFEPSLKTTQKKVIFLTKEELQQVRDYELTEKTKFLEPVRDIFLFCCFSSLRFSDAMNLKWNDVKDDHIEVTTVKTADSITIEINNVMRGLLDKYQVLKETQKSVFPTITNQAMNRDLKELCRLAGINSEERITTYKGTERHDEIVEKWELIGTHTGRRTFIVNALSRGISPSVVMKWTGHSDYASMKPYIDIVDSIKASEMNKMNFFD